MAHSFSSPQPVSSPSSSPGSCRFCPIQLFRSSKYTNIILPNSIPETKGLSLEKMDDLFGVTELAKKMEDEEGAHDIPPAKDFEGEKTQHVEVSQVNSNTKH
jgi:hypothetical protein